MARAKAEWERVVAGHYEHPKFGRVWKESRGWYCHPRNSIARGPSRTMRSAMLECEREAH
jgi:hypothetical protein